MLSDCSAPAAIVQWSGQMVIQATYGTGTGSYSYTPTLLGGSGDDILVAGSASIDGTDPTRLASYSLASRPSDFLSGGGGDDQIYIGAPLQGGAAGAADGGDGNDTLHAKFKDDVNGEFLFGTTNQIPGGPAVSNFEILDIQGSSGNDTITGGDFDDTIAGYTSTPGYVYLSGQDVLSGGGGNDWISGASSSTFDGGDGIDTLRTDLDPYHGSVLTLSSMMHLSGGGTAANFERFDITGSGLADTIIGGSLGDTIRGWGGQDLLRGGGGDDSLSGAGTLEGGAGNDTLEFTGSGLADGGAGFDTAYISSSYSGPTKVPDSSLVRAAYSFGLVKGDPSGLTVSYANAAEPSFTLHDVEQVQFSVSQYGGTGPYSETVSLSTLQAWAAEPCYARGTRILTDRGEVPVEELREGDRVRVLLGAEGFRPVRWVGHRRVALRHHPMPERARPVRFRAGSLAEGVPHRDLLVSPDHALFLRGVLVHAETLINGATVVQEEVAEVEYFHVELDAHDVMVAEGAAAE
ncbi:Hint domain-containing protein, partial [Roseomonas elaeocarpi]